MCSTNTVQNQTIEKEIFSVALSFQVLFKTSTKNFKSESSSLKQGKYVVKIIIPQTMVRIKEQ